MNILFFCASLEAGRDGVGDYTLRLAGECVARGHVCRIIALHDPHVDRVTDGTDNEVGLTRLPATHSWPERLACATDDLRRFGPDWVSWQFVAYGFHNRGFLPAELLQNMRNLRGERCHIMLHELWLGLQVGAGLRERASGWLQRRGVVCLLDRLGADVVHTSNSAYQAVLIREGFAADVLDLFGNVPLATHTPGEVPPWASWLPVQFDPTVAAPLVGVTFGTLHSQWRPQATVEWMIETAARHGREPVLLVLGRAGSRASGLLDVFRKRDVTVVESGELDEATISRVLSSADFGIAPHPWALIGKSGAAAAMLEHGLPILVPRDDWKLRDAQHRPAQPDSGPLLVRLGDLDAARTDRWLGGRRPPAAGLTRITTLFLQATEAASSR